jgi:hypothetical protein
MKQKECIVRHWESHTQSLENFVTHRKRKSTCRKQVCDTLVQPNITLTLYSLIFPSKQPMQ